MKFCIIIFILGLSRIQLLALAKPELRLCAEHIVCMHLCIICISSTLEVMGGIICLLSHPTVSQSNCHPTAHQASELGGHLKLQCNDRRSFGVDTFDTETFDHENFLCDKTNMSFLQVGSVCVF